MLQSDADHETEGHQSLLYMGILIAPTPFRHLECATSYKSYQSSAAAILQPTSFSLLDFRRLALANLDVFTVSTNL